jgi:hypothetical protein
MKRQLMILFALSAVLVCLPVTAAHAANGHSHGGGRGHGFGGGFGSIGLGFGGGCDYGWDIAELYRQLYNNLPYFALHPPVYYSEPVPRTYGYSPFAYPPGVMTPDVLYAPQPVTINNPYVPATKTATPPAADATSDRAASVEHIVEPLVIVNPYVTARGAVVQNER